MKRSIWAVAAIFAAGISLSSCLDNNNNGGGGYYPPFYPNGLVTVKSLDSGDFYLQLDDSTTLKPSNVSTAPYNREVRAFVNFTDNGAWTGSGELSFDRDVTLHWIDSVRTKDAVLSLESSGENDTTYGTAGIEIIDNWVTVLEDDYLTLAFSAYWGDPTEYHEINLVAGVDETDPYLVELRHNPLEDATYESGKRAVGIIAFRLDDVIDIEGGIDHLTVKYQSFSGTKTVEIKRNTDYYNPDLTGSKASTTSTRSSVETSDVNIK